MTKGGVPAFWLQMATRQLTSLAPGLPVISALAIVDLVVRLLWVTTFGVEPQVATVLKE